ncbi:hypothetical protein Tco_1563026 [Tanacetum coccineum]
MHNFLSLRYLNQTLRSFCIQDFQAHFYRLSHSELVGIEKNQSDTYVNHSEDGNPALSPTSNSSLVGDLCDQKNQSCDKLKDKKYNGAIPRESKLVPVDPDGFEGYLKMEVKEIDNPDMTMEEYVQLETERAIRNGKIFEKEFPAIVYNDALASKSDFLSEPTISPQHVDEVNLKNETLLYDYDDEKYNVISFNGLLHFNIIFCQ